MTFAGAPVTVSEDSVDVFDSFAGTLAVHLAPEAALGHVLPGLAADTASPMSARHGAALIALTPDSPDLLIEVPQGSCRPAS